MRRILKLFNDGNVCVYGLRGRGKDLLMSNVAIRRKKPYVSNVDYGGQFLPLELDKLDCGGNTFREFINGDVRKYSYPYPDGTDVYVSDAGVYFPSQYNGQLDKEYPYLATFQALSRHVGLANFHTNAQSLSRVWLKIREQSDTYLQCLGCLYIPLKKVLPWTKDIVLQKVRVYEKYDTASQGVLPFKVTAPLLASPQTRTMVDLQRQQHASTYGRIRTFYLCYLNMSTYDTRHYKEVLKNGK